MYFFESKSFNFQMNEENKRVQKGINYETLKVHHMTQWNEQT